MRDTILITDQDMGALTRLLGARGTVGRDQEHLAMLAGELERATVVPSAEVPPDVVTMGSRVIVQDADSGEELAYTLAWSSVNTPEGETRVSVLAPIGTALLGYREGDEIEWRTPGGLRRFRVARVVSQPEAARRRAAKPAGREPRQRA